MDENSDSVDLTSPITVDERIAELNEKLKEANLKFNLHDRVALLERRLRDEQLRRIKEKEEIDSRLDYIEQKLGDLLW